jgi:tRNA(Ile)-lysidine synthase
VGSKPGNLLEKVTATIVAGKLLAEGERIVVAVSGGVDSMVLLEVLHRLAAGHQWQLTVAHFNHQLRGQQSDADERLVRKTAARLKIPAVIGRASVRTEAKRRGWSIEMAARQLRHQFLARTAKKAKSRTIALAHHQDDQVELFFLRLLRGAGGEGLAGMKSRSVSPVEGSIFVTRPLLACSKAELREFAAARRILFSEDETNASLEILRNRVRHTLLPLLRAEFQPALDATVLRAMDLIGAENEAVRALAEEWRRSKKPEWKSLPLAAQRQVLQAQLFELGAPADFDWVERLRLGPGEPMAIGGEKYVSHDGAGLVRVEGRAGIDFLEGEQKVHLGKAGGATSFGGLTMAWEMAEAAGAAFSIALNTEQFDADRVGESIVLRHWRPGDRFRPIGSGAARKLQDVFTDLKAPKEDRRRRVVATTAAGEIFWVQGVRIGEVCKLRARTRRRLVWRWKETQAIARRRPSW